MIEDLRDYVVDLLSLCMLMAQSQTPVPDDGRASVGGPTSV